MVLWVDGRTRMHVDASTGTAGEVKYADDERRRKSGRNRVNGGGAGGGNPDCSNICFKLII